MSIFEQFFHSVLVGSFYAVKLASDHNARNTFFLKIPEVGVKALSVKNSPYAHRGLFLKSTAGMAHARDLLQNKSDINIPYLTGIKSNKGCFMESNQIVAECQNMMGNSGMENMCSTCMHMDGYHQTLFIIGALIVLGLIVQIVLLTKLLKAHHRTGKKK